MSHLESIDAQIDRNTTTGEALAIVPSAQAILEQHGCPSDWKF